MIPDNVFDTKEASSLHALDGRAGRRETEEKERRWEVWVHTTRKTWSRCNSFWTEGEANTHRDHYIKTQGAKWKKLMAVVEVVAVARTETVTTRTVRSPIH